MASYGYYTQAYYKSAVSELDRFITKYPKDPNLDYAYYLLAMCHYESIVDEKKDLKPLLYARDSFNLLIEKPLTVPGVKTEKLSKICKELKLKTLVGYNMRFTNRLKSILNILKDSKKVRRQIIELKQDVSKPNFGRDII